MRRTRTARKVPRPLPPVAGALLLLLLGGLGSPARGEIDLSIFTGVALTQDNDLDLHQSGATDLTFHGVSYEGRDFEIPPFYGARALWFPSAESHWGFGAEFFHLKLYAETDEKVHVTGRRNGASVNDNERVDDTIESFSLSHGLNFALGDIVYRWLPGNRGQDFLGHLQPYAGSVSAPRFRMLNPISSGKFDEKYQLMVRAWKRSRA